MNTDVFNEFLDKNVEVSTGNKTFTGSLKKNVDHGTLVITPTDKYAAKRFGPAIVDQNAVISIRAIHPREELLYDSDGVEEHKQDDKRIGYFQSCDSSEESAG